MKRILSYSKGAGIYTIESEEHAKILRTLAEKNQMPLSVLIRLSSGNQFGVDAETFFRLAKEIQESPYLTLAGVHYYAGTQKRQSKLEKPMPVEKQVVIIYAATRKYLLDIEVDRILEFESGLFEYISTKYPDIFEKIREEKKLSDELEDALKKAITEFKETF